MKNPGLKACPREGGDRPPHGLRELLNQLMQDHYSGISREPWPLIWWSRWSTLKLAAEQALNDIVMKPVSGWISASY